jgi:hypothetical protein
VIRHLAAASLGCVLTAAGVPAAATGVGAAPLLAATGMSACAGIADAAERLRCHDRRACSDLADATERLACFDALDAAVAASDGDAASARRDHTATPAPAAVPARQPRVTPAPSGSTASDTASTSTATATGTAAPAGGPTPAPGVAARQGGTGQSLQEVVLQSAAPAAAAGPAATASPTATASPAPAASPPGEAASAADAGFGLPARQAPAADVDEIESRIVASRRLPRGNAVIKLANGQVWLENEPSPARIRPETAAKLRRGTFGSFWLSHESGPPMRVRRVDCEDPRARSLCQF